MFGIFLKLKQIKDLNEFKKFLNSSFAREDGITKDVEKITLELFNKSLYELTDKEWLQLMNKTRGELCIMTN